jgi:hypothetical protein
MKDGTVQLGDIVGKITMFEDACARCERHCRLRVARPIEQHGVNMGLPELRHSITTDYPRCPGNDL